MKIPTTLYHFTAARFANSILAGGLTRGQLPIVRADGSIQLASPYQWLTTNPSFDQPWCRYPSGRLPYKVNEVRFKIILPRPTARKYLVRYLDHPAATPEAVAMLTDPEDDGPGLDSVNWWLFQGILHAVFIVNPPIHNPDLPTP